jgi:thiol-disulfide isomerase/thioredoxin
MKFFTTLVLLFCFINVLTAQDHYEQKALSDAIQMTLVYNQKDFAKYVDYLLPAEYNNDTANKKGLLKIFNQNKDTSKLEVIKLLKLKIVSGEQQAVFLHRFHQRDGYIIGVYTNKSRQWQFTQPLSQDVQFDLVLSMVPSLDTAFALVIDPKYGKRIKFIENQKIPAFRFTDIKGNLLTSDNLTGKVLVLNFWSITCGPCLKEIPQLNELVEKMKSEDVVFIAPAFYSPKDYLTEKFLPKHPFAYNIVEITNPDDYNIFEFPTHIVTDKNHNIIYKVAAGGPENIKELNKAIQNALSK